MMTGHCFGAGTSTVEMTVGTDTADYNLLSAYTAAHGAPTSAVNVICTIPSNVGCYKDSGGSVGGFRTGGFPAGSSIKLIIHGTISGKRGIGGVGGTSGHTDGYAGSNGSTALYLDDDVSIDVDGLIGGGGGGGGGGGYVASPTGGGFNGGDGGNGKDYLHVKGHGEPGSGNSYVQSGDGGDGGGWGSGGIDGGHQLGGARGTGGGGAGGTSGKAIERNGRTITWIAGYDTTHVKGNVAA